MTNPSATVTVSENSADSSPSPALGTTSASPYDAIVIVGFGGPEGREEVLPFLENVLRGRNIPRERMLEVAEHYYHFEGISPINQQVRDLIAVLKPALQAKGMDLPVYWGNRNWHPLLTDEVKTMTADGVKHALGVVLAAYSSYSSCRQYRENILAAREMVGPDAPIIDKMRVFYNHPGFIQANADRIRTALETIPADRRSQAHIAFTAHSIPSNMADQCNYVIQLKETCRLLGEALEWKPERLALVYQSRSGRPTDPWLEPDILDHIRSLRETPQVQDLVVHPVGFLSDHMEVMYDLDCEAMDLAQLLGIHLVRSGTVGTHPDFVDMLAELITERITGNLNRRAIGTYGPSHDVCPVNCCPPPARPGPTNR